MASTQTVARHEVWFTGSEITKGCGGSRYCPSSIVTREQMVAFLYRAFATLWGS